MEHSAEGSPVANGRFVAIDPATGEVVREIPMTGRGMDRGIAEGRSLWVVVDTGLARVES